MPAIREGRIARKRFPIVLASGTLALHASACGEPAPGDSVTVPAAKPTPEPGISGAKPAVPARLNAAVPAMRFRRIAMPLDELRAQTVPVERSTRNLEGADEAKAAVNLETGQTVTGNFGAEGKLFNIEADTPGIAGNTGIGIGAPLSDLPGGYPDGRLISSLEEGRYASDPSCAKTGPLRDSCWPIPALRQKGSHLRPFTAEKTELYPASGSGAPKRVGPSDGLFRQR